MSDLHHLSRHDERYARATPGWHVRVRRRNWFYRKFFADANYGGKDGALAAARDFRDRLLEELADEEQTTADRRNRLTARNTSGMVGVRREPARPGRGEHWVAYWTDDTGKRRTVRFSVAKLGQRDAKASAKLARELLTTDRATVAAELERRRQEARAKRAVRAERAAHG